MSGEGPRVFVAMPPGLREQFFSTEDREHLESISSVSYYDDEGLSAEDLATGLTGAEIAVTGWGTPQFDERVMAGAEALKLVAHTGGSVATLVSERLFDAGVRVCSADRPMARFVAELTLGHVLAAQRGIVRADRSMRTDGFDDPAPTRSLIDGTIGLVGLGTIGRYLLEMLRPFDVTVRLYDPYVPPVAVTEYSFVEKTSLERAMASSIISIHAARTPETRGMIGEPELAMIPDDGLLVNTARASITDRDALYAELERGRIRAAIDVFHEEPLPADDPLRGLENVQLSAHMGGNGPHELFGRTVLEEIERFVTGGTLQHEIRREQAMRMTQ